MLGHIGQYIIDTAKQFRDKIKGGHEILLCARLVYP